MGISIWEHLPIPPYLGVRGVAAPQVLQEGAQSHVRAAEERGAKAFLR